MKLLKAINLSIIFILSIFSFLEINRANGSSKFESEPPKVCLRSVLPSGLISITGNYRRHYENGIYYISREDLEIGLSMYHRAMADKEQLAMIENQDELSLIQ